MQYILQSVVLVKSSARLQLRQLIYISEYIPPLSLSLLESSVCVSCVLIYLCHQLTINELIPQQQIPTVAVKVCAPVRTLDAGRDDVGRKAE
jgi:hypothetical protein